MPNVFDVASEQIKKRNVFDLAEQKMNVFDVAEKTLQQPQDTLLGGIGKGIKRGALSSTESALAIPQVLQDIHENTSWGKEVIPALGVGYNLLPENAREYLKDKAKGAYEYVKGVRRESSPNLEGWRRYAAMPFETGAEMMSYGMNLPAMSAGAGLQRYLGAREEGYNPSKSGAAGALSGVSEYVTEYTPFKFMKGSGNSLSKLGLTMAADVPGEVAQTGMEIYGIDQMLLGKEIPNQEKRQALIDTIINSIGTTGLMTGITHPYYRAKGKKPGQVIPEATREEQPVSDKFPPEVPERITPEQQRSDPLKKIISEKFKQEPKQVMGQKPDIAQVLMQKQGEPIGEEANYAQQGLPEQISSQAVPEPSTAKEPWQMTKDEYAKFRGARAPLESDEFTFYHLNKIPKGIPGISLEQNKIIFRDKLGDPVGVTTLKVVSGEKVIDDTVVRPDKRRQGIATRLYEKAIELGHKEGYVENIASVSAKHKIHIRKAISEGKKVPEEVLKDYPGLLKQVVPKKSKGLTDKAINKIIESNKNELLNIADTTNIFKEIKNIASNVKIDRSMFDHFDKEEIMPLIRKVPGVFSKNKGMPLDEIADGLGITTDSLADKMRNYISGKESKAQFEKQIKEYSPPIETVAFGDTGLNIGDKFKLHGEQYMVKNRDEEGNYVIKDGDTYVVDEFDKIPKPDEGSIVKGKPTVFDKLKDETGAVGDISHKKVKDSLISNTYDKTISLAELKRYGKLHNVTIGRSSPDQAWSKLRKLLIDNPRGYDILAGRQLKSDAEYLNKVKTLDTLGLQQTYEKGGEVYKNIKETIKPIANRIKEFVSPISTMPESQKYLYSRSKAMGNIDRISRFVVKLRDKLNQFDEPTRNMIYQFTEQETDAQGNPIPSQLDIELKKRQAYPIAVAVRNLNRRIGLMGVKAGAVSKESYEKFKNKYIRQNYLKYLLGENADKYASKGGLIDVNAMKKRKDLPKEYQRGIGLVEDISVAEPLSVSKALQNIVNTGKLNEISNNPNWTIPDSIVKIEFGGVKRRLGLKALEKEINKISDVVSFDKTNESARKYLDELTTKYNAAVEATKDYNTNDWAQMPDSPAYGDLSGMIVRKQIYRDIVPVIFGFKFEGSVGSAVEKLAKVEREGMNLWKMLKVSFNIPTAARNVVSNSIQFNGKVSKFKPYGTSLPETMEYVVKAARKMIAKDMHYHIAVKDGIFKSNFVEGELNEIVNELKDFKPNYFDIISKLKKLSKYYGKIDDLYKFGIYLDELDHGATREYATNQAQKWGMDYTLAHPSIKYLRRHVLPFASYQYKIYPLLAESLAKQPWSIGKYLLLPSIATAASSSMMGFGDDDYEKLWKTLPMAMRKFGMFLMPWKSKEGNSQWINLEPFVPFGTALSFFRNIKMKNWFGTARDIGVSNPYADIYSLVQSGVGGKPPTDPFSGQPIYNQLDSAKSKVYKTMEWVYNKWMPAMITKYGTAGKIANIGEKDKYGRVTSVPEAVSSLGGVNVIEQTKRQTAINKKVRLKELKTDLYRKMLSTESKEKKKEAMDKYRKMVYEVVNE